MASNISATKPSNIEILIVEDSRTQANKLKYLIEHNKGYVVRVAANGRAALEEIEKSKPDLVISDIMMPEMTGYELCHYIKSHNTYKDISVILVTSLVDSSDIVEGITCGADNFIRKPYNDDYLLACIDHVLLTQELRKNNISQDDIVVNVGGKKYLINAPRQQILDLLISTYEQAFIVNEALKVREKEVSDLNVNLKKRADDLERANNEIIRSNMELESANEEKSNLLTRIKQKNIELDFANRAKSEFLANMSHELRTPLNAIIGFSEAMKDGLLGDITDVQKSCMVDIFESGEHLLSLINDILDLAKIESGKVELELVPADIDLLLANSLSVIKERAFLHNIKLKCDCDDIGLIAIDARKVKQIVFNLLSNAIKFTPDGGSVVLQAKLLDANVLVADDSIVGLRPTEPGFHSYVRLSVRDSGIGIGQAELKRLFQPFVQLDSGLARKYEGTGLGLVIIKQLAELHSGHAAVRSHVGEGSEFAVWLPYRHQSKS